jgi:hypothetical protein
MPALRKIAKPINITRNNLTFSDFKLRNQEREMYITPIASRNIKIIAKRVFIFSPCQLEQKKVSKYVFGYVMQPAKPFQTHYPIRGIWVNSESTMQLRRRKTITSRSSDTPARKP